VIGNKREVRFGFAAAKSRTGAGSCQPLVLISQPFMSAVRIAIARLSGARCRSLAVGEMRLVLNYGTPHSGVLVAQYLNSVRRYSSVSAWFGAGVV